MRSAGEVCDTEHSEEGRRGRAEEICDAKYSEEGRRARVRRKASAVMSKLWRTMSRRDSSDGGGEVDARSTLRKEFYEVRTGVSSGASTTASRQLAALESGVTANSGNESYLREASSGSNCSTEESTAKRANKGPLDDQPGFARVRSGLCRQKGPEFMSLQTASGEVRISTPMGLNTKGLSRYELVKVEAGCLLFVPLRIQRGLKARLPALDEDDYCFWKRGLPATKAKLTLVLDLDETSLTVVPETQPSGVMSWKGTASLEESTVFLRPFFLPLLRSMKAMGCEIIVFSTRSKQFSDTLLDLVDPEGDLIDHRLYCHHALVHPLIPGTLCKNLSGLNRDMERCLLIDDSTEAFSLSPNNGWQIAPYSAKLTLRTSLPATPEISQAGRRERGRLCEPVVLAKTASNKRSVVGCAARDFALLTAYAWVKELMRSNRSVPEFTKCNRNALVESLVKSSNALVVPETAG